MAFRPASSRIRRQASARWISQSQAGPKMLSGPQILVSPVRRIDFSTNRVEARLALRPPDSLNGRGFDLSNPAIGGHGFNQ